MSYPRSSAEIRGGRQAKRRTRQGAARDAMLHATFRPLPRPVRASRLWCGRGGLAAYQPPLFGSVWVESLPSLSVMPTVTM
jgi:hypothetical protein